MGFFLMNSLEKEERKEIEQDIQKLYKESKVIYSKIFKTELSKKNI